MSEKRYETGKIADIQGPGGWAPIRKHFGVESFGINSWTAAEAVCPTDLPLYSERQYASPGFPHPRYSPDSPLAWTWGYSVTASRRRLVPQAVVLSLLPALRR